nr:MAG TPA: hypothetical protein [Caudoviricetes sp.]
MSILFLKKIKYFSYMRLNIITQKLPKTKHIAKKIIRKPIKVKIWQHQQEEP